MKTSKFHATNEFRQLKRVVCDAWPYVGLVLQQKFIAAEWVDGVMVKTEEWRDVPLLEE